MSAIDVQNAKQIRDPMDVLITLSLGTDIAMTYSGYSSAKVADGVLNQSSWPMRGLADLQGDGFPLDGSRALYDPNTSPSQTNGKLGVRGNVGQPVSVTAAGAETIAALAISVTGAASVTLNGETTEITGSHVTLQLLNTTAALTFQPSSEDRRVEIITVLPEADFVINNDNLIKATVSLRSDLSIIDPTLPESELNVEVYQDEDVSEAVASIPEDTPITYQAGYPGDMSPVRKFYISGQVTWKDNVLSIQAVDAVHFLDWDVRTPIQSFYGAVSLYRFMGALLSKSEVTASSESPRGVIGVDEIDYNNSYVIKPGCNVRGLFAELSNLFHQEVPGGGAVWVTYVDAGIPKTRISKPEASWVINEDDCGDTRKTPETAQHGLRVYHEKIRQIFPTSVGSAEWVKDVGTILTFSADAYSDIYYIGVYIGPAGGEENLNKVVSYYPEPASAMYANVFCAVPAGKDGHPNPFLPPIMVGSASDGGAYRLTKLITEGILQSDMTRFPPSAQYDSESAPYATFIPWDAYYEPEYLPYNSQRAAWQSLVSAGIIDAKTTTTQLEIYGKSYAKETDELTLGEYKEGGAEMTPLIYGEVFARALNGTSVRVFPRPAYESLLKRSNITCSFTWKGDPRIQPRDVFTFHRLDGTDEEWTFENITITHEGGGTLAEVTARKGIV